MDDDFLATVNTIRAIADFPFPVNSGYRCEKHNREVGSTSNNHTRGLAIDIHMPDSTTKYRLIHIAMLYGFTGIGVYPLFIHLDKNREIPYLWTSSK